MLLIFLITVTAQPCLRSRIYYVSAYLGVILELDCSTTPQPANVRLPEAPAHSCPCLRVPWMDNNFVFSILTENELSQRFQLAAVQCLGLGILQPCLSLRHF